MLKELWCAIKFPVIIVSPRQPTQILWAAQKNVLFPDFSEDLAYSNARLASRFTSYKHAHSATAGKCGVARAI